MKAVVLFLTVVWASMSLAQERDCFLCLPDFGFLSPIVPEWPIEYVKIEKPFYEKNPKATYCKRPTEMIDTIVLHHSETRNTDTPETINRYHLNRGPVHDPWYMVGYSYLINSPYPGGNYPRVRVSEGRPLDLVGAHAGSNVFIPMDETQKKLWSENKIICGKDDDFKVDPSLMKDGKIKANVTTIGLVVVGNYSPYHEDYNPNGYRPSNPRFPTTQTIDLVARTACQLQKKHSRMKYIKWHSYYHNTSCPGDLVKYIDQIKNIARKYGCEFQ